MFVINSHLFFPHQHPPPCNTTYTCSLPASAHTKSYPLVKCNIKQDIEHESSKTVLGNPILGCLFLILYCSILSLLKLQYVACITLYSPSLLGMPSSYCLSVLFLSFKTESSGFRQALKVTPFILQLLDCCNHLLDDFAISELA